jgi:hypothetical protein
MAVNLSVYRHCIDVDWCDAFDHGEWIHGCDQVRGNAHRPMAQQSLWSRATGLIRDSPRFPFCQLPSRSRSGNSEPSSPVFISTCRQAGGQLALWHILGNISGANNGQLENLSSACGRNWPACVPIFLRANCRRETPPILGCNLSYHWTYTRPGLLRIRYEHINV